MPSPEIGVHYQASCFAGLHPVLTQIAFQILWVEDDAPTDAIVRQLAPPDERAHHEDRDAQDRRRLPDRETVLMGSRVPPVRHRFCPL